MSAHAITAVVVNHNAGPLLAEALDGLSGHPVDEIVVVDNDSTDGSAEAARRDGVVLLEPRSNLGFAGAVNLALEHITNPLVLLLNADVRLGARYVERLAERLESDPSLAAATGVLRLPGGAVDSSGIAMTTARWASDRDRGRWSATDAPPFGVSGAAALYRRQALEIVSWAELFVYWEDVELAWRLRRAGWSFATVAEAEAVHERGSDRREPTMVEAASFGGRLATISRHEGLRGHLRPATAAVSVIVGLRLALRHPRALRRAQPLRRIRAGRAARVGDRRAGWPALDPASFTPHPWRAWLTAQVSGGRRGFGAVAEPPHRLGQEMS